MSQHIALYYKSRDISKSKHCWKTGTPRIRNWRARPPSRLFTRNSRYVITSLQPAPLYCLHSSNPRWCSRVIQYNTPVLCSVTHCFLLNLLQINTVFTRHSPALCPALYGYWPWGKSCISKVASIFSIMPCYSLTTSGACSTEVAPGYVYCMFLPNQYRYDYLFIIQTNIDSNMWI